jgi:hypothetical protein
MRNMMPSKIIGFIIFVLLLFPLTAWSIGEDGKTKDEKHIYTVIEFESTFMNRRKEKVLKVLGEPDNKWEHQDKEVWKYFQIITDQEKLWDQNLMFDFGRVNAMWPTKPVRAAGGNGQSTGLGAED